jgi:hypothetical protein
MLRKLVILLFIALYGFGCGQKREAVVEEGKDTVASNVKIGDDIFSAKQKLEEAGLRIKYGPDFPTKSEKYLMMIVDYGARPNGLETFRYTVGFDGSDEPISGIIKATPGGEITSIE